MNILVIGSGYVGLVAGTCFAETGNDVICVDTDKEKIKRLESGDTVIYEPGLETLLKKNINAARIKFSSSVKDHVANADVIFTAVGTPMGEDGSADLVYLTAAVKTFAPLLAGYTLIVNKCTVPVGTLQIVKDIVSSLAPKNVEFDVASNPEFLKEGVAVQDFLYPDRVVVGVETKKAEKILTELYEPFVKNGNPIHVMDVKSAELTKYACNSFLATKISFMNDMAVLCEKVGADIHAVRHGMSSDSRIGKSFLYAGVGYGGSCFPKDVKALIKIAENYGEDLSIVRSAEKINMSQRQRFTEKILNYFKGDVSGKVIAVWGLAFKPQTDDMRQAPSIDVIETLAKRGAVIHASDPVAIENAKLSIKADVKYFNNHIDAVEGAQALVVLTEWNEYRTFDPKKLKNLFKGKVIFDGRNIWNPTEIKDYGYDYFGVGRRQE